jgi:hypothetical protein
MLKAAGDRVELVIVAEAYIHAPDKVARTTDRITGAIARAAMLGPGQRMRLFRKLRPWVRRAALMSESSLRENAQYVVARARRAVSNKISTVRGWFDRRPAASGIAHPNAVSQAVLLRYLYAIDAFVAQPYHGRAIYLKAEASPFDATEAWRAVAPNMRLQPVRGDHNTCITTQVDSMATHLREALREAQDSAGRAAQESERLLIAV